MEPMVIARLVQLAALRGNENVLVVAAGSGYGAAVMASCGARVTALEEDPALLSLARAALATEAPTVKVVVGSMLDGWSSSAPFDVILIEGAVEEIPPAIAAQLKREGGRLLTVRVGADRVGAALVGQAVFGEMTGVGLSLQPVFDCAVPLLPAMRRASGFVF
jgi:protein-L-isoaspartate(D-aspartate) O-methyltransferase